MARQARNRLTENPGNGASDNGSAGTVILASAPTADGTIIIDPATIAGSGSGTGSDSGSGTDVTGEPVRKRRGRKPGSRNKETAKPLDINGVEFILLSSHDMLAAMMKAPAIALDKEEANNLARSISNVARHYDIVATEKTLDWTALFMALGMIYGPRIAMLTMRKKKSKEEAQTEVHPTVGSVFHNPAQVQ